MRLSLAVLALFAALPPAASAQQPGGKGEPAIGLELSAKLCSGCHVIAPDQVSGTVSDGVPSFMEIAPGRAVIRSFSTRC